MKKQSKFSIEIPKPCTENRAAMDKTTDGWFCKTCSKEVIDFTQKSDAELRRAFDEAAETPCGVFRPDQLSRPISARKNCNSYSNTFKALSLALTTAMAADACFMGKRAEPRTVGEPQVEQIDGLEVGKIGEEKQSLGKHMPVAPPKNPTFMGDTIIRRNK